MFFQEFFIPFFSTCSRASHLSANCRSRRVFRRTHGNPLSGFSSAFKQYLRLGTVNLFSIGQLGTNGRHLEGDGDCNNDDLSLTPLSSQRFKAGDHVEQLFVDGFLPYAV